MKSIYKENQRLFRMQRRCPEWIPVSGGRGSCKKSDAEYGFKIIRRCGDAGLNGCPFCKHSMLSRVEDELIKSGDLCD